jgi:hypothetical protein
MLSTAAQHTSELKDHESATPPDHNLSFRTVATFSDRYPEFSRASLRNLIFKAETRESSMGSIPGNGLLECGAIVRLGRRVLINEAKFLAWVASGGRQT